MKHYINILFILVLSIQAAKGRGHVMYDSSLNEVITALPYSDGKSAPDAKAIISGLNKERNYIVTSIPLVAASDINSLHKDSCLQTVLYFDGLGRPTQNIQVGITPLKHDLVSLQDYDGFGREIKKWLPTPVEANAGGYISPTEIHNISRSRYNDTSPYSETVYEPSPLSRIVKQYGSGEDWRSNNKAVEIKYKTNSLWGRLSCAMYVADGDYGIKKTGNYAAGELLITETIDEDGNLSCEFEDKSGRVLLTRQIDPGYTGDGYDTGYFWDTYYVYDDFNNLRYVLPPLASDALSATNMHWADNHDALIKYAYIYKYDYRRRCTGKKLPGCDPVYYVYDNADRIIYTQDGEQRKENYWIFNKYDQYGRLIISGLHKAGNKTYETLFQECEKNTIIEQHSNTSFWYGYTSNTLPAVKENEVLFVNFYDDYSRVTRLYPQLGWDKTQPSELYAGNGDFPANGLLVGTVEFYDRAKGYARCTAYYYDQRDRLTQRRSTNMYSGLDTEFINYNFTGQPVKRVLKHTAPGAAISSEQLETYNYTYDHAGRLTKTTHKLNSNADIVLAENKYDELGRLSETKANNQNNLKVGYQYNIRSWTKKITNTNFSQTLYYNETYKTNKPAYNGNISAMEWVQGNGMIMGSQQYYILDYDHLSQLKKATAFVSGEAFSQEPNRFSSFYEYDKHGNMISLQRYLDGVRLIGKLQYLRYTEQLDDVDLGYNGNQLKVADNYISTTNRLFKDYTGNSVEYYFDKNGSMTQDHNRKVVNKYDLYSGMPKTTSVNNSQAKGVNEYIYTATGEKLMVKYYTAINKLITPGAGIELTVNENTVPDKTIAYISNRVYENGGLKRILIDNGYIENGNYYFYIKDHLGNNRMVVNYAGTVVQRTDYFPFGTPYPTNYKAEAQPYKFGGKEYDQMHGLDQYDFHARQQDGIRFTSIDPMAEKYYSWSPYVYCMNNPMKYIDLKGDTISLYIDGYLYYYNSDKNGNYGFYNSTTGELYEGENTFAKELMSALGVLRTGKEGKTLIDYLIGEAGNVLIVEMNAKKGSFATKNIIAWYPGSEKEKLEMIDGSLEISPNYIDLAHEMAHVRTHWNKTFDSRTWFIMNDGGVILNAEKQAMHIENLIRAEQGLNIRRSYIRSYPISVVVNSVRTSTYLWSLDPSNKIKYYKY